MVDPEDAWTVILWSLTMWLSLGNPGLLIMLSKQIPDEPVKCGKT
jgi:hypothetical protein